MEFDNDQEFILEQQVNLLFEDNTHKTTRERIGAAAFNLLTYIDRERELQTEITEGWKERDSDARIRPPIIRFPFSLFAFSYIDFSGGLTPYVPQPGELEPINSHPVPDELSETSDKPDKTKDLEEIRRTMEEVTLLLAERHDLKPRQINKAVALARRLKAPKSHKPKYDV